MRRSFDDFVASKVALRAGSGIFTSLHLRRRFPRQPSCAECASCAVLARSPLLLLPYQPPSRGRSGVPRHLLRFIPAKTFSVAVPAVSIVVTAAEAVLSLPRVRRVDEPVAFPCRADAQTGLGVLPVPGHWDVIRDAEAHHWVALRLPGAATALLHVLPEVASASHLELFLRYAECDEKCPTQKLSMFAESQKLPWRDGHPSTPVRSP